MDDTGLVDWRFNPDGTADYYTVLAAEYVEGNTILELTFDANLPLESAPYSVESPTYSARTSSNISILANENEWTFDADGKLRLPGSILFPNALEYTENGIITSTDTGLGISLSRNLELSAVAAVNSGQGQLYIDTSANNDTSEVDIFWKLNTGTFGVPVLTPITSVITPTPGVRRISVTGVTFVVGQTYTFRRDLIDSVSWLFQSDGTLRTSGLGTISHYPGLTSSLKLEVPGSNNIVLRTTGGNLTFGADGSLTLPSTLNYPNSALQRDTALVMCPGNASTVVYIASADIQHTVKLLIQVEGLVGAETLPDTQSCEMIVAKSFRGNNIAATVYAIVHTSIAPLATFTAEWNAVTSRVEVICTPTGANGVNVKSFATEITAVVT
jgi:hypothetical protein